MTFNYKNMKIGFTLVDFMIVLAIMGLLAAVAVPSFVQAKRTVLIKELGFVAIDNSNKLFYDPKTIEIYEIDFKEEKAGEILGVVDPKDVLAFLSTPEPAIRKSLIKYGYTQQSYTAFQEHKALKTRNDKITNTVLAVPSFTSEPSPKKESETLKFEHGVLKVFSASSKIPKTIEYNDITYVREQKETQRKISNPHKHRLLNTLD